MTKLCWLQPRQPPFLRIWASCRTKWTVPGSFRTRCSAIAERPRCRVH